MFCGALVVTNSVVRWKDIIIYEIRRNTSFITNHNVRVVWIYALKAPAFPLLCMLFTFKTAILIQSALVCGLVPVLVVVSDSECIARLELSLQLELISTAASSGIYIGHVQVSILTAWVRFILRGSDTTAFDVHPRIAALTTKCTVISGNRPLASDAWVLDGAWVKFNITTEYYHK